MPTWHLKEERRRSRTSTLAAERSLRSSVAARENAGWPAAAHFMQPTPAVPDDATQSPSQQRKSAPALSATSSATPVSASVCGGPSVYAAEPRSSTEATERRAERRAERRRQYQALLRPDGGAAKGTPSHAERLHDSLWDATWHANAPAGPQRRARPLSSPKASPKASSSKVRQERVQLVQLRGWEDDGAASMQSGAAVKQPARRPGCRAQSAQPAQRGHLPDTVPLPPAWQPRPPNVRRKRSAMRPNAPGAGLHLSSAEPYGLTGPSHRASERYAAEPGQCPAYSSRPSTPSVVMDHAVLWSEESTSLVAA